MLLRFVTLRLMTSPRLPEESQTLSPRQSRSRPVHSPPHAVRWFPYHSDASSAAPAGVAAPFSAGVEAESESEPAVPDFPQQPRRRATAATERRRGGRQVVE